jgi:NOL1/NOP2/fmu family ribosome biogenesis protein
MWIEKAIQAWIEPYQPLLVLDLCAAPGGKSTHLLDMLPKGSLLVSNEVIKSRSHILTENLSKWGSSFHIVTRNEPGDFQKLLLSFDVILVDAPCSGEGLFRKDTEAIGHWSQDACAMCSTRQEHILDNILPLLKEGGVLLYSTCTYNPEENEARVAALQNDHGMEILHLETFAGLSSKSNAGQVMGYQCYPHRVEGEGFFFAGLRKTFDSKRPKAKKGRSPVFSAIPRESKNFLDGHLHPDEPLDFFSKNNKAHLLPQQWIDEISLIYHSLFVVQAGTIVGEFINRKFNPDPAWALSTALLPEAVAHVALDYEQAILYLAKAELNWPPSPQGWVLVTYEGLGLGWIKRIGQRVNNYWPAHWRIRMKPEEALQADRSLFPIQTPIQ